MIGQDEGYIPSEVAEKLGVRANTVYCQMRLIRLKLDTRHWFQSWMRYRAAVLNSPSKPRGTGQ